MRLLYCYVQFLDEHGKDTRFRGLDKIELNFSTVDRFMYDRLTGTLRRKKRTSPLPEHFWNVETAADVKKPDVSTEDTNIYNINVVSGENGSGKTTVMHYVIDLLDGLHAAVDPDVSERNRMERLGVAGNRALLLLESDGSQWLLDYEPFAGTEYELPLEGFSEVQVHGFVCTSWRGLNDTRDETGRTIGELLRKTKIIYLNNTLSQRDHERHLGERNERLRDFFVYDASIGATIGPDIAQFFPYEVYKQVKYVFDKNQVAKRAAIKDRVQLRLPNALRLRPRTELLESMGENDMQNKSEVNADTRTPMVDGRNPQERQRLSAILGRLCVAAFAENLRIRANGTFLPLFRDELKPSLVKLSLEKNISLFNDIKEQFRIAIDSCLLEEHAGEITCLAALSDELFVSGSRDGTLRLWDATNNRCLYVLLGHSDAVECVVALPGGRVVSGSRDGTLRVWLAVGGECQHVLRGHGDAVWCLAALSDELIVSGSRDGSLRVWDVATGACLHVMRGHVDAVSCLVTLPGGRVASGSRDCTLRVWDVTSGKCLHTMKDHGDAIKCVAALPGGLVISGANNGTIRVWDANTGACLHSLRGHGDAVWCLEALPGGFFVSGSRDGTLSVWDAATGDCLRTLKGHGGPVSCVAALPEGRFVSGAHDGTIRVWEASTGRCLHALRGHSDAVWCLSALPGGLVVSGSSDGSLRSWPSLLWDDGRNDGLVDTGAAAIRKKALLENARWLELLCRDYMQFISEKDESLFSRFQRVGEQTYELSLESLRGDTTNALYTDLIDFMQKYRYTCEPTYTIDFDWGLSSGEENMLRIFSNLYHVFDRDYSSGEYGDYRIYNNESHSDDDGAKTSCDSVLLFMDEADLTLHPEWQRRLISILATFIPQIYPWSCAQDIQLILSTHSPLLLGDIPSENITYLPSKEECQSERRDDASEDPDGAEQSSRFAPSRAYEIETFGQNVHTILKESFFLNNGTVGDFAGKRINRIAAQLKRIEERASSEASSSSAVWEELQEIEQNISVVAHGILRTKLEMLYRDAEAAIRRQESAGSTPSVQQLLSDARALSKDDRYQLLLALSEESQAND